jgi:hypothetical protein
MSFFEKENNKIKDATSQTPEYSAWENVRQQMHAEFGEAIFRSWLKSLTLSSVKYNTIELSVPTRYMQNWIQSHYAPRILEMIQGHSPDIKNIRIITSGQSAQKPSRRHTARLSVYLSDGPGVRIRGTAHQIATKYQELAKEAAYKEDLSLSEEYTNHAKFFEALANNEEVEGSAFIPQLPPSFSSHKENLERALLTQTEKFKNLSKELLSQTEFALEQQKIKQNRLNETAASILEKQKEYFDGNNVLKIRGAHD